jgi:methionyl-tRNA formyltransferase
MKPHRIVFMGTPPFAVASLRALLDAGVDVAAVVTAPDRPAGRGRQPRMSAVKEFALQHALLRDRLLQPERLRDPDFHRQLDATGADLYVVVAFRMLPESVWQRPPLGTINLHASLLPDHRGAAPINWAVIHGGTCTGATTFFLQHAIDTGDIIDRVTTPIGPDETAGDVHDRLMVIGAELLVRSVHAIFRGEAPRTPQNVASSAALRHAPKLTPANTRIDPRCSAKAVHDLVRGLSPMPGAWSILRREDDPPQQFKVLRSALHDQVVNDAPGTLYAENGLLLLQCADGRVSLLEVHPEGRKRMPAAAFIHGLRNTRGLHIAHP